MYLVTSIISEPRALQYLSSQTTYILFLIVKLMNKQVIILPADSLTLCSDATSFMEENVIANTCVKCKTD